MGVRKEESYILAGGALVPPPVARGVRCCIDARSATLWLLENYPKSAESIHSPFFLSSFLYCFTVSFLVSQYLLFYLLRNFRCLTKNVQPTSQ
jgi:hypothetical protein